VKCALCGKAGKRVEELPKTALENKAVRVGKYRAHRACVVLLIERFTSRSGPWSGERDLADALEELMGVEGGEPAKGDAAREAARGKARRALAKVGRVVAS